MSMSVEIGIDRPLTPKERALLHLFMQGYTALEAAKELNYSISTIQNRTCSLLQKYNAVDKLNLICLLIHRGFLSTDDVFGEIKEN